MKIYYISEAFLEELVATKDPFLKEVYTDISISLSENPFTNILLMDSYFIDDFYKKFINQTFMYYSQSQKRKSNVRIETS